MFIRGPVSGWVRLLPGAYLQWAPTRTAHDPNPPITLEDRVIQQIARGRRLRGAALAMLTVDTAAPPPATRTNYLALLGVS